MTAALILGWPAPGYCFPPGHVFVSVDAGKVQQFDPTGALVTTLDTFQPGPSEGLAFDSLNSLYVANYVANSISKFDSNGGLLGTFASVNYAASIQFTSNGDAYVGTYWPDNTLYKLDSQGNPLAQFQFYWGSPQDFDIAPDQCRIFYNYFGSILVYDVCTNTQLPVFASLPGVGYGMRVHPNGDVIAGLSRALLRIAIAAAAG